MIWALVVQTKDFAAFLSTYPHIRVFVEDQSHDRGTYEPAGHNHTNLTGLATGVDNTAMSQPSATPTEFQQVLSGQNCTVIITDVVAFGARKRTDEDRLNIREAVMTQAAMNGLVDARVEDRGDGVLIVIPPTFRR